MDSLKLVWNDPTLADTTRLDALSDIMQHGHIRSYKDSVAYYAELQINESKAKGSDKHLANAYMEKAFYLVFENQIELGIALLDSAIAINKSIDDSYGLAISQSGKGSLLMYTGMFEEGFELTENAFKKMDEEGNLRGKYICAGGMINAYSLNGDISQQFYYAKLKVQLAEELNEWVELAESYHNMADVYLAVEITDEGDYYHEQALEYCRKSGYKTEEVNILSHLASIEEKRGNYIRALELLEEIKDWTNQYGTKIQATKRVAQKIYFLVNAKMYDEAKIAIEEFHDHADEKVIMFDFFKAMVDFSKGKMLLDLGQPRLSVGLCRSALEGLSSFGYFKRELDVCKCIYDSYKEIGDHQKALEFHEKYQLIQEKFDQEQAVKDLQRFEFQKQIVADSLVQVKLAAEIQLAHEIESQKKDMNRNIAIGSGLFFLLLAGGFFSRWRYVKKSKAIIEKEKDRSNNLLLNILPADYCGRVKNTRQG